MYSIVYRYKYYTILASVVGELGLIFDFFFDRNIFIFVKALRHREYRAFSSCEKSRLGKTEPFCIQCTIIFLLLLLLFGILIVIGQVPVLYDTIIVRWRMILREKSDLPSSVGQCSRRVHYYIRPQDYIIYNQFENATVAAAVAIIIGVGTVHACLAEN